jgi:TATA-binding protein-associated factor
MIPDLLSPHLLPAALAGLGDRDDDVIAAAADALLPAAGAIAREAGGVVPGLLGALWDALLDLDDLSPSTGSVMALLAKLYAQPGVAAAGRVLGFWVLELLTGVGDRSV